MTLKDYIAAGLARGAYGSGMRQFMESYDFLLTPSVATPAFDVGRFHRLPTTATPGWHGRRSAIPST